MIFIDPPSPRYVSPSRRGVNVSWLVADTDDELHAFAASIGLKREWCLTNGFTRYDLGTTRRAQAVAAGATELSADEFKAWLDKRKG